MARVFMLGAVFLLFSGSDYIGTKYTNVIPEPLMHFEWWWKPFGQLSSNITNIFWAPQHAIAGFLSTFLFMRYPQLSLRNAGVIAAATAGWSPFAAIGLIPSFFWAITKSGHKGVLSRSNLICSPVLLVLSGFFLTNGSASLPAGFIWNVSGFTINGWLIFLLLEVWIFSFSLALVLKGNLVLISFFSLFLTALTLFTFGQYNDLLMRASVGSLGALAFASSIAVVYSPNDIRKVPLIVCLVLGLATPLGEITRSLVANRMQAIDEISISEFLSGRKQLAPQYLVYEKSNNEVVRYDMLNLSELKFTSLGSAEFENNSKRIESTEFTDAALVSNDILLPPGIYKLDAILEWDVSGGKAGKNAAHVSIHRNKMLISIMTSRADGERVSSYFRGDGNPFKLSFGLGGWATGKGFIQLKELKIGLVGFAVGASPDEARKLE